MAKFKYCAKLKSPEPKTFRGATSPVTVIKWALGIGTLEYPTGHPRRAISLCWSGAHLVLFSYCIWIAVSEKVWDLENSLSTQTSYQTYIIACALFSVVFMYRGQVSSKKLVDSFCKIDRVNEILNKLGIPKEYGSTFKSQIFHVVGGVLFTSVIVLVPVIPTSVFDELPKSVICSCVSGMHIILVSFFEDFTFISCIRYIAKRFRHLNMYLEKLSQTAMNTEPFLRDSEESTLWLSSIAFENNLRSRRTGVAVEKWMLHILRNSRKIHCDLCNVAKTVNEAFGIQILLSMATAMVIVTTVLFNTYTLLTDPATITTRVKIKYLVDLLWIGFYGIKAFWIISACSMASTEAHQMGDRISQLVKPATSNGIREEIHAFLLQLMDEPLELTAHGFFTLDHTLIRAMVGTVTAYLVIMIQMPRPSYRASSTIPNATIAAINTTV